MVLKYTGYILPCLGKWLPSLLKILKKELGMGKSGKSTIMRLSFRRKRTATAEKTINSSCGKPVQLSLVLMSQLVNAKIYKYLDPFPISIRGINNTGGPPNWLWLGCYLWALIPIYGYLVTVSVR